MRSRRSAKPNRRESSSDQRLSTLLGADPEAFELADFPRVAGQSMESPHMRSVPVALLATAVLSGAVAAGILLQGSEHLSFAAPPEAPEETRAIPLESCYANFGRGGWKIIRDDSREPYGYDLAQLFRDHKGGASNIVLVRGNNIAAAVKATRWAFTAGRWADTPISCYQDGRKGEGED